MTSEGPRKINVYPIKIREVIDLGLVVKLKMPNVSLLRNLGGS